MLQLNWLRKHSWIEDVRTYATGVYIVRPRGGEVKDYGKNALEALLATLKEIKPRKLAVEKQWIDKSLFDKISRSIGESELIDANRVFTELRMIKSDQEIERFREATRICCRSIMKVIESIEEGVSESELLSLLKTTILREGGNSWQQTTIAIGPENGPNIYNQPSDRKIIDGDIIRIDLGCIYNGYTADLARTIVFGQASEEAKKIYTVVREATEKGIEAMKPGVKASDIHKIVVDIVRQKYDMHYTRGNVGHGVGVELYDEPELRIDNQQKLIPGMTISVEAPYHKFGLGGFIVEESVLVTEDGHEVVSDISKELFLD